MYLGEYPAAVCKPRQKIPVEDIPAVAMKKHSDQRTKQILKQQKMKVETNMRPKKIAGMLRTRLCLQ